MNPTAVIPLKGFAVAKGRLAPVLDQPQRSSLARTTAEHVLRACAAGGFDIMIVTGDQAVEDWAAQHSAIVIPDPSQGLDAACRVAVEQCDGPWVIVHGDLPLLDGDAMNAARTTLGAGGSIIAPSRDGGTNLLGTTGQIRFSYGQGSFHRHLAVLSDLITVYIDIKTLIELDTPGDLSAAAGLPGGAWLSPFLT
jgi:2-phospho-L-lactate guanylyltransferase